MLGFGLVLLLLSGCRKEDASYIYDITRDEPPVHPFLADSPWPISHKNTYAQASSMLPGPSRVTNLTVKHYEPGIPGLITMAISGEYPNGKRVIWGNVITHVFKAEDTGGELKFITALQKEGTSAGSILDVNNALSGAYTLVDRDGFFYVPKGYELFAFGDAVPGDPYSDIRQYYRYEIPGHLREADERIVGLTLTYDGYLVFATNNGVVGLLDRSLNALAYFEFAEDDKVSNSIACDENGGIYVVTSKKMYRVQWTGSVLTTDESLGGWEAEYETGAGSGGIRLGEGSGATPTLMGVDGQDKFVVITDGQDLMHIVLFWRDQIPGDWQQIPGTKDRRIAAQVPVTFGNPGATKSLSEQSVCVRGYGALVVNNQLKNSVNNTLLDMILSGNPENAPYGAEKFVWSPSKRKLQTAWANRSVSFPNGIPSMSAKTNMVYNIGQKNGVWTFDALDWSSGRFVFQYKLGNNIKFNSAYAPTEIGLNGAIYSGTLFGMVGMWE
jgi:hypothetical protein